MSYCVDGVSYVSYCLFMPNNIETQTIAKAAAGIFGRMGHLTEDALHIYGAAEVEHDITRCLAEGTTDGLHDQLRLERQSHPLCEQAVDWYCASVRKALDQQEASVASRLVAMIRVGLDVGAAAALPAAVKDDRARNVAAAILGNFDVADPVSR